MIEEALYRKLQGARINEIELSYEGNAYILDRLRTYKVVDFKNVRDTFLIFHLEGAHTRYILMWYPAGTISSSDWIAFGLGTRKLVMYPATPTPKYGGYIGEKYGINDWEFNACLSAIYRFLKREE